jgi:hypothetical protein
VAKVAVLTALNLADELEGLKNFYEAELREVLERARAEEEAQAQAPATPEPEPYAEQDVIDVPPAPVVAQEESSWFDAIFDFDAPPARTNDERLSSQITSRLRRLRQASPGNSITEGEGDA